MIAAKHLLSEMATINSSYISAQHTVAAARFAQAQQELRSFKQGRDNLQVQVQQQQHENYLYGGVTDPNIVLHRPDEEQAFTAEALAARGAYGYNFLQH